MRFNAETQRSQRQAQRSKSKLDKRRREFGLFLVGFLCAYICVLCVSALKNMPRLVDQPAAQREADQLIDTVQVQLLHDAPAMRIHRVDAEVQHHGDLDRKSTRLN